MTKRVSIFRISDASDRENMMNVTVGDTENKFHFIFTIISITKKLFKENLSWAMKKKLYNNLLLVIIIISSFILQNT